MMKKLTTNYQLAQEILDLTEKEIQKMPPVNILLVGKSGVGKSTLINSVFREQLADTGIGKPVTQHLKKISKDGIPINLYDTQGLELSEDIQQKVTSEFFELIHQQKGTKDEIHVCYYCIQATGARIEEAEIKLIESLASKLPVILVLTMSIGDQARAFEEYIRKLDLPLVGVQSILAQPYMISEDLTLPAFGLKELIQKTLNILPSKTKKAFTNAQVVDIAEKVKAAKKWTKRYILTTFGVGFTPIPFSDASVLIPMQITMMAHITAIFGVSINQATIVSVIGAVGGTGSATFIGRTIVSSAFKFLPGVGTIVGGLISGTTASVVTSALGYSYIQTLRFLALNNQLDEESSHIIIKIMQKEFGKYIRANRNKLDTSISELEVKEPSLADQWIDRIKPAISNTIKRLKRD